MFLNGILEHTALCTKTERLGSVGETGRDPGMWESGSGSYPETERLGSVGETGPEGPGSRLYFRRVRGRVFIFGVCPDLPAWQ